MSEAKPELVTIEPRVLPAAEIGSIRDMPEGCFWTRDPEPKPDAAKDRLIDMVVPGISDWMDWKRVLN